MKILIVCSANSGSIAPFIKEQVDSLVNIGLEVHYFYITKKGAIGYIQSRKELICKIHEFNPNIIHAHFGLSGLLANLQRKVPVVTTYHGSDINLLVILIYSKICIYLSKYNIFVSRKLMEKARPQLKNSSTIACGVDLSVFYPMSKGSARSMMNLKDNVKYILFAGSFHNTVKNYPLAKEAVDKLKGVELIELKGYTREQVNLLMNASDAVLLTSFSEGSPQFIKEALACNRPIVAVNVGDVMELLAGIEGCFVCKHHADEISNALGNAIEYSSIVPPDDYLLKFDNKVIANQLKAIYQSII